MGGLNNIVSQGLALAAVAAGVLAFWLYVDNERKADRIVELTSQVVAASANAAAYQVQAEQRPQVEIRYRDAVEAVNAAGERTSDACLTDPRVRAAYDAVRRMRAQTDKPSQ